MTSKMKGADIRSHFLAKFVLLKEIAVIIKFKSCTHGNVEKISRYSCTI